MDEKTIPLSKLPVDIKVHLNKGQVWAEALDYRALFEQTGECVVIIGLDFRIITANTKALQLLGYDEGQLIGMPVEDIMPLAETADRNIILEQKLSSSEQTLKRKDGSTFQVELSMSVVHNAKSMPAYVQMVARDITERKHADRVLKRHMRALAVIGAVTAGLFRSPKLEERIPEVLETLGYAVNIFNCAIFDLNGNSINVKYEWTDHTVPGFQLAQVIQPFVQSLSEMPERVFSVTDIPTSYPAAANVSLLAIPIQGTLGQWGFLALLDREDRLSWLPTIFDIVQTTANLIGAALERVHYEETLRLSEARNRIIVDALPDVILRIDLSGKVRDFFVRENHPLYAFRDLVLGGHLKDLLPKDFVQKVIGEDIASFTTLQKLESFTIPQNTNTFEAELHPISGEEALIIVRDITERARLDQMKSDFINRASHELRTPLTSAILMVDLIQQGGAPDELDEYWRTLSGELNRQKDLINDLLLAGRLESGNMKLEAAPMDVMPAVFESAAAVKPIANKRRISIVVNSKYSTLQVLGDKGGLQQVFINLITNAVKFSPENGIVDVRVVATNENVQIAISDQGLGIPPESISHLFERFYRAKNVTIAEIPGSGIGLYIVKSIVEELGGRIVVESIINQGTTFIVTLNKVH